MLLRYMDSVAALMPAAERILTQGLRTPDDAEATVALINRFFGPQC